MKTIEDYSQEHRAFVRKLVWSKILLSIILSIMGLVLPLVVQIHYIPFLGNSLLITSLILMVQGIRVLRAYRRVNQQVLPKAKYDSADTDKLKSVVDLQILQNTVEQKVALGGLIISVVICVVAILSQDQVLLAASFIPIVLVLAIEFCFTLVLLYQQNQYRRKLE